MPSAGRPDRNPPSGVSTSSSRPQLLRRADRAGRQHRLRALDPPARTRRNRLSRVSQNFIRPETIPAANAHVWGNGEAASADRIRFVAPSSAIVVLGPLPDSLLILGLLLEQETE